MQKVKNWRRKIKEPEINRRRKKFNSRTSRKKEEEEIGSAKKKKKIKGKKGRNFRGRKKKK